MVNLSSLSHIDPIFSGFHPTYPNCSMKLRETAPKRGIKYPCLHFMFWFRFSVHGHILTPLSVQLYSLSMFEYVCCLSRDYDEILDFIPILQIDQIARINSCPTFTSSPYINVPHTLPDKVDADPAPATSYPRINTWSGGLNEMEEARVVVVPCCATLRHRLAVHCCPSRNCSMIQCWS